MVFSLSVEILRYQAFFIRPSLPLKKAARKLRLPLPSSFAKPLSVLSLKPVFRLTDPLFSGLGTCKQASFSFSDEWSTQAEHTGVRPEQGYPQRVSLSWFKLCGSV